MVTLFTNKLIAQTKGSSSKVGTTENIEQVLTFSVTGMGCSTDNKLVADALYLRRLPDWI